MAILESSTNRFLVAERLNCFGTIIVPYLEQLLNNSNNLEVKILAALVLLQQNSNAGISVLLSAIESDREYAGLAAEHLSTVGIKKAIEPICERLRSSKLEEIDLIVSLLDSLNKLDAQLPQNLYRKFSSDSVPWQIRTKLKEQYSSAKV